MNRTCQATQHDWVFCEDDPQVGLAEGYYCRHCGIHIDNWPEEEDDEP